MDGGIEPLFLRWDAGDYPDAMRNAAEYRGVRLIDLEKATARMFGLAGPENSKRLFCHVAAGSKNYPDCLSDNSHLQEEGALSIAELFLSRMRNPNRTEEEMESADCNLIAREDSVLR